MSPVLVSNVNTPLTEAPSSVLTIALAVSASPKKEGQTMKNIDTERKRKNARWSISSHAMYLSTHNISGHAMHSLNQRTLPALSHTEYPSSLATRHHPHNHHCIPPRPLINASYPLAHTPWVIGRQPEKRNPGAWVHSCCRPCMGPIHPPLLLNLRYISWCRVIALLAAVGLSTLGQARERKRRSGGGRWAVVCLVVDVFRSHISSNCRCNNCRWWSFWLFIQRIARVAAIAAITRIHSHMLLLFSRLFLLVRVIMHVCEPTHIKCQGRSGFLQKKRKRKKETMKNGKKKNGKINA